MNLTKLREIAKICPNCKGKGFTYIWPPYGGNDKEVCHCDGEKRQHQVKVMKDHFDALLDVVESFASVACEEGVREQLLCYVQGVRALEALAKLEAIE